MSRTALFAALTAGLLALGGPCAAQVDLKSVFQAPIAIERTAAASSTPLEMRGGKLFVQAAADGQSREFIFDTGSPTILTRAFADALGLRIIGQNTGVDANGEPVTMDVAILGRLTIGETTFRDVPVLVFDYATLDTGACLVDAGVLGSEILPGGAWRIDLQARRLSLAESAAALRGSPPSIRAKLHDFGYPHAPIIDYAVGAVSDKALFDTGAAEPVKLFAKVAENPSVRRAFAPGSLRVGRGSEGESAGGRGASGDLLRFELADFRIGGRSIGAVPATTRSVPPTLVGAGLLAAYVVTLDYPGGQFLLEPRSAPEPPRTDAGFSIAFVGDQATVVQLFDGAPAARAGLRLADHVVEAQGRSLAVTPDTPKCGSARWLAEGFDPARATELVVLREGVRKTIRIPAADGSAAARN